jgi:hypothetical protein
MSKSPIMIATPSLGVKLWRDGNGAVYVNFANEGGRGTPYCALFLPIVRNGKDYAFRDKLIEEYQQQGAKFWLGKTWRRSLATNIFEPRTEHFNQGEWPGREEDGGLVIVLLAYRQLRGIGEPVPFDTSNMRPELTAKTRTQAENEAEWEASELEIYMQKTPRRLLERGIVFPANPPPRLPIPDERLLRLAGNSARIADRNETVTFAVGSCQYPAGFMDGSPADLSAPSGPADASLVRLARRLADQQAGEPVPSLLILAGDQVYVDATAGLFDPRALDDRYNMPYKRLYARRGPQAVLNRLPVAMVIDDHEVENNWEPPDDLAARKDGMAAYRKWQRLEKNGATRTRELFPPAPAEDRDALWYYFEHRGIRVFAADTRTQRETRTPATLGDARIMGDKQRDALFTSLATHRGRPQLVVSPSILLPRRQRTAASAAGAIRSDAWDGYPASLHELLAYLCKEAISQVVFLSGDEHLACASKVTVTDKSDPKKTVTLHSVHASALYAPYPFANSVPEDLEGDDLFDFNVQGADYTCTVETWFPRAGDSFALVSLAHADGGWTLDVLFDKGLPDPEQDRKSYPL